MAGTSDSRVIERIAFSFDGLWVTEDEIESTQTTASFVTNVKVDGRQVSCRLNVDRRLIEERADWQQTVVDHLRDMAARYLEYVDRPE